MIEALQKDQSSKQNEKASAKQKRAQFKLQSFKHRNQEKVIEEDDAHSSTGTLRTDIIDDQGSVKQSRRMEPLEKEMTRVYERFTSEEIYQAIDAIIDRELCIMKANETQ